MKDGIVKFLGWLGWMLLLTFGVHLARNGLAELHKGLDDAVSGIALVVVVLTLMPVSPRRTK